jgi:membrane fusion protein, copper/silver efflux system
VTLLSPFAGQAFLDDADMVDRTLMVGSQVSADTPLLKIVDNRRLSLVFHVPEGNAHMLREGQHVDLSSDDLGELPEVEAMIGRVSNEFSTETRSREVRIYLKLPDGTAPRRILPGSLLTGRIRVALAADLTPADADDRSTWGEFTLVPKTAILSTGVRHLAWRVAERNRDGSLRFEPVAVALGPRLESDDGSDHYVVRHGLKADDQIATQAAFLIDSQAQLAGTPSLLMPDGAQR